MIDLTEVFQVVITLFIALITTYVVPYIKSKTTAQQQADIQMWIKVAVQAAEQVYNESGHGKEKKQYVLDFLFQKGFYINELEIDNLIESAVYTLKEGV